MFDIFMPNFGLDLWVYDLEDNKHDKKARICYSYLFYFMFFECDRFELLSMVKKHSKLLGQTTVDQEDSSDVEMDPRFWHDVLNLYFLCSKEARGRQDDDMLFFVRKMVACFFYYAKFIMVVMINFIGSDINIFL